MDDVTDTVLSALRHDLNNARSIVGGLEAVLANTEGDLVEDAAAVQMMLEQVTDLIDIFTGVSLGGRAALALGPLVVRAAKLGNLVVDPPDDGGIESVVEARSLELALRELIRNASFSGLPAVELTHGELTTITVSPVLPKTPRHAFACALARAVAERHEGTFTLDDGRAVLTLTTRA